MKSPKYLVIALVALAILSALTSCSSSTANTTQPISPDSVEFIVWRAYNISQRVVPVYLDKQESLAYRAGDVIEVNDNGVIPAKSQEQQTTTVGLCVQVGKIRFSRDDAERRQ